jgi:hypothetical protein
MIALRRVDVAELNERARGAMRTAVRLDRKRARGAMRTAVRLDRKSSCCRAPLSRPAIGWWAQRNERQLGLTNGSLATVERVDIERQAVTLRTCDGRMIEPRRAT